MGMYSLIALEARSLKLRTQQGWFLLESRRENLFHAFLLLLASLAFLGLQTELSSPPAPPTRSFLWVCMSQISLSPFSYKDTSY